MQRLIVRSAIVLFVVLAGLGASIIVPASAECRPPSDWGTYTVARGDTLSNIARRFNTTAAALAQGNCLYNPNYLLVGQVIRVPGTVSPPSGGTAIDFPTTASQIGSTYQAFENGFMIWRATTGSIWVFVWQGRHGGYVTQIPLSVYGGMSGDARYWQPIPEGRGLPVIGIQESVRQFPGPARSAGLGDGRRTGFPDGRPAGRPDLHHQRCPLIRTRSASVSAPTGPGNILQPHRRHPSNPTAAGHHLDRRDLPAVPIRLHDLARRHGRNQRFHRDDHRRNHVLPAGPLRTVAGRRRHARHPLRRFRSNSGSAKSGTISPACASGSAGRLAVSAAIRWSSTRRMAG